MARALLGHLVVGHDSHRQGASALRCIRRAPRPGGDLASLAEARRAARRRGRADRHGGWHRRDSPLDPVVGRWGRGAGAARAARVDGHCGAGRGGAIRGVSAGRIEAELKFRAADERPLEMLAASATLGPAELGPARTADEVDRYLDTADLRLAAVHWACRLRSREGSALLSLKGPAEHIDGATLHLRPELEGRAT